MSKTAIEIAKAHLTCANPSSWDGIGDPPSDFDSRIATYRINAYMELDISFEQNRDDGWLHCCELRDAATGDLLEILHGYGINSPQNLADTIEDITKEVAK